MVLSEHRWFRVFYLCALYFAQGFPGALSLSRARRVVRVEGLFDQASQSDYRNGHIAVVVQVLLGPDH